MAGSRFCRKCAYDLGGIASPSACPECGRAFNASDRATFDTAPWRTRRRRRIRIGVGVCCLLVLLVAVCPRGYVKASLNSSIPGAPAETYTEFHIVPSFVFRAMGVQFPSWSRVQPWNGATPQKAIEVVVEMHELTPRGMQQRGSVSAWGAAADVHTTMVNDIPFAPENAHAIFETVVPDMMHRRSFGITSKNISLTK